MRLEMLVYNVHLSSVSGSVHSFLFNFKNTRFSRLTSGRFLFLALKSPDTEKILSTYASDAGAERTVLVHTVLGRHWSDHAITGMHSQWHTVCAVSNQSAHQVLMWWITVTTESYLTCKARSN